MFSVPAFGNKVLNPRFRYPVYTSGRYRSPNANAYLSRTFPANPVDRTRCTISLWVRRGRLLAGGASSDFQILFAGYDGSTYAGILAFGSDEKFLVRVGGSATYDWNSTKLINDSKWHHFVVQIDTTLATAADRVKVWIDGVAEAPSSFPTPPPQNTLHQFTLANGNNRFGTAYDATQLFFDGLLTEVDFVDGYVVPYTEFGYQDTRIGAWGPKPYTGFYGANGFHHGYDAVNIVLQSQDYAQAVWQKIGAATVDSNATTAPDGTLTGDKLNFVDGSSAIFEDLNTFTVAPDQPVTWSAYCKWDGVSNGGMNLTIWWLDTSAGPVNAGCSFDIQSGLVGSSSVSNPTYMTLMDTGIENVGNGWYRCWVTAKCSLSCATLRPTHYPIVIGQSVYAWGAQVQFGDIGPYIVTTTVPNARFGSDGTGRTNLMTQSQNYAAWALSGGSLVTPASYTAPDGTLTGWLIDDPDAGQFASIQSATIAYASGADNRHSVFVLKDSVPASVRQVGLRVYFAPSASLGDLLLNTQSGAVTQGALIGAAVLSDIRSESYGAWWRVSWNAKSTDGGDNSLFVQCYPALAVNGVYDATLTGTCGLWGWQMQRAGDPLAGYLPTGAAGVTTPNDWTQTAFDVGSDNYSYDCFVDSPTNEYQTMNPLQGSAATDATVLRDALLTAYTATSGGGGIRSLTPLPKSGKWYWELNEISASDAVAGIARSADAANYPLGAQGTGSYQQNGAWYYQGAQVATYGTWGNTSKLAFALDADAGKLWFRINGVWQNSGDPVAGTGAAQSGLDTATVDWNAVIADGSSSVTTTQAINFGQRPFDYAVPDGFKPLNWESISTVPPPVYPESVYVSASNDVTGTKITVNFSQALTGSVAAGTLQYRINGGASINVTGMVVSGSSVTGTLPTPAQQGQTLQVQMQGNTTLDTLMTGNAVADFAWATFPNSALPLIGQGQLNVGNVNNLFWGKTEYPGYGSYSPASGPNLRLLQTDYAGQTKVESIDGTDINGINNLTMIVGGNQATLQRNVTPGQDGDPDVTWYGGAIGDVFNMVARSGQNLTVQILST